MISHGEGEGDDYFNDSEIKLAPNELLPNPKNGFRLLQVGSVHSEGLITDEEMDTRETSAIQPITNNQSMMNQSVINQPDYHNGSDSRQLASSPARPSLNNREETTFITKSNKQQVDKNKSNLELSLSNSFNDNDQEVRLFDRYWASQLSSVLLKPLQTFSYSHFLPYNASMRNVNY